jgi:hypothetical protein
VVAQALKNRVLLLKLEGLAIDNVFIYAGLRVVFQRGKGLVAELGEAVAGACSCPREEEAEERRGAVRRGLATEGIFGHAAYRASQPKEPGVGIRDTTR